MNMMMNEMYYNQKENNIQQPMKLMDGKMLCLIMI
jgi:hypothetical protein